MSTSDPVLQAIVEHLRAKHRCHTVILYGSRARGEETPTSDYDVAGVRARGPRTRQAGKVDGAYWDLFVYSEKDLKKFSEQQWAWKNARILWSEGDYGRRLLARLEKFLETPFQPAPKFEIEATRAWSLKQLERCEFGDVHGYYRRCELQVAALSDYFQVRKKRYPGPKAALQWLQTADPDSYALSCQVYEQPTDGVALRQLIERVYRVERS
ncbi:nucleotidyltransferase domain-containing protein [bacterium]|nr:nucleotidyltransferase domain-containing protein [bacterium]